MNEEKERRILFLVVLRTVAQDHPIETSFGTPRTNVLMPASNLNVSLRQDRLAVSYAYIRS